MDGLSSIGVLGGTFNPPHLGHLALARHAREELGLDRVLLMPASTSPHKSTAQDPGAQHRLRMCRLLLADSDGLSACALELKRGGLSFTVDTLQAIHAGNPDAELTFIVGADTVRTLPTWREPCRLVELARFAVAARAGAAQAQVRDAFASLPSRTRVGDAECAPAAVRFLQMPAIEVSSSMARARVARGEPIADLVGAAVAEYIAEHDLYGAHGERSS